tara:strand:+ start:476 stop:775 length:300 start_codon:yes stop_codon:yes gene_type:complete
MNNTQEESLYEQSMKYNCEGIRCLQNAANEYNQQQLSDAINCKAYNTREIRNVDHERPMMFDEYRFKHLNYCTIHTLDGYSVCKDCKSCAYSKNIKIKN